MLIQQFVRPDQSVYLIVERDASEGWYHLRWIGEQALSTVMDGGLEFLAIMRRDPEPRLLNDHTKLRGTFEEANDWIAQVIVPLLIDAGLRYIAHILSPDLFAQLSMDALSPRLVRQLELRLFDNETEAKVWLREVK